MPINAMHMRLGIYEIIVIKKQISIFPN